MDVLRAKREVFGHKDVAELSRVRVRAIVSTVSTNEEGFIR